MIVVEDGTGKSNANSYASVEFANEYFETRGELNWAGATADNTTKAALLIRGTDYAEMVFGERFLGTPQSTTQALHFPATGATAFARGTVPLPLQKAICEYARIAKDGPLVPTPEVSDAGVAVVISKEVVGPIETSFSALGGDSAKVQLYRSYPQADGLLCRLLRAAGFRTYR